jgi:signal transduction histidine kinase
MSEKSNGTIPHKGDFFSQPVQLTSDELENVLDFTAVTSKARVEGLQNDLISRLHRPTVILEFRDNLKEPIRHEPITLFDDSEFPCTILRMCTCEICHKLDNYYAELFKGLTKDTLKTEIVKKIDIASLSPPIKTNILIKKPEFFPDEDREGYGYLNYDCPITGYRETVFPIFIGNKILGVLFVGRISLEQHEKIEADCRKEFIETNPEWIKHSSYKFPEKNTRKTFEKVFLAGKQREISAINSFNPLLNEGNYLKEVKCWQKELDMFQKGLTKFLDDKRKEYMQFVTNKLMDEFYEDKQQEKKISDDMPDSSSNDLPEFWHDVRKIVNRLSSCFKISNINVFGPDRLNNTNETGNKPVILKTMAISNDMPNDYNLTVQLPEKEPSSMKKHQYHTKNNDLLSLIHPKDIISKDAAFLFFPALPNQQDSMALLLYISENSSKDVRNVFREQIQAFSEGLMPLFLFIFARLSAILKYLSHKQLNDTLQIYRHEVVNNIRGLESVYKQFYRYLKNLNTLRDNEKTLGYLYNKNLDLNDIIALLRNLTENARVVNGLLPDFSSEVFPLVRGILLKWKHAFSKDMTVKGQILKIINYSEDDDILIRTDKSCLDQIVYNLINNAHKYAHHGSTIYMCYNRIEEQSFGELTVTDYGLNIIEEQEKPYRLFYRGDNTRGYKEGSGIGLYVSQQIATGRLKTKIYHTCKPVSKYYVPFIEPYLEMDSSDQLIDNNQIKEEFIRLNRNGMYQKIVSYLAGPFGMPFTDEEIKKNIIKPTYEVTFTLEINDIR